MWSSGIGTGFAISLKRDRFDGVFLRRGAIVGEREAFPFKCKGLAPVGFVCGKGFVELELPSLPLITISTDTRFIAGLQRFPHVPRMYLLLLYLKNYNSIVSRKSIVHRKFIRSLDRNSSQRNR